MKTKDRILLASLDAFSEEGIGQISTNHIADILDISPGNLYYHFKSKGEIIIALYDCFKNDFSAFVESSERHIKSPQEIWLILNLTFQLMSKYRFIFRDASFAINRYPELNRPFNQLLKATRLAIDNFCKYLQKQGLVQLNSQQSALLSTSIHLTLTQWFDYAYIYINKQKSISKNSDLNQSSDKLVDLGVSQTISLIQPYMAEQMRSYFDEILTA
ncbi:TetR/AcrR family transcriptional regulator [Thalassotalea psychrophila]|uniref:TetR/AcrR family transcriptional regulator n=1 Tax=Thalassotalea psychrophila TaxID=3065647 RepID=A0ABY9U087_9GAMM|nr:TetR/AcrR family transcriptional regulator [Colwelliaceae bacterium SQ149]